jgi:hypothetical protein
MDRFLISLVLWLLATGCGGDSAGVTEAGEDRLVEIHVLQAIGVELGDSSYVLGAVQAVDLCMEGNVLVLDRSAGCIRVYSPQGEFLMNISRLGSGPGELTNPLDMTVVGDGRIFVETPWSGGMNAFDTQGEWLGLVTPFQNNPPMQIRGADGNAYVATRLQVAPDESGNLMVTTFIGRYEEGEEPMVIYWENSFPFDPHDLTALLRNSMMSHTVAADRAGNVFISKLTSDFYRVEGYRPGGERFLLIEKDAPRVAKTPLEIEEEEVFIESYLQGMGASGVVIEYNADPYRYAVSEVETDGERIWVRRGTELQPVFDVYDYQGEFLFTATVPEAGDDAAFWDFRITDRGMLAFSTNPDLFQQVYILEMP